MIFLLLCGVAAALWGGAHRLMWVTPGGDVWSLSLEHVIYALIALRCVVVLFGGVRAVCIRLRAWVVYPFQKRVPVDPLGAAAEAFRAGRLRRVLSLLQTSSKTDPTALRFVMRTHLMRRRPDRALEALSAAIRVAPAPVHAAMYRRVRPLVSPSVLLRFREILRVQPDVPAIRRLRALDAFLDGRSDEAVLRDIALAVPPLQAELLRAAVRARRAGNDAASETVLLAALPDDERRDDDALAAAAAWLFADAAGGRPLTVLRPPGADGNEDYAQT